ncbi:hypothetical protein [Bacillus thuringiensis]|uniref:GTP pyrophosphokinase n=1 Tax=Bacillus thuringiensis TaxID=1428 RepID=A0A9X6VC96_BACTU|nr:hypothetical protein [Bacillus thuringiensis]MEC3269892.1 hypothetical protein [Bacillus thuringiensis]PFB07954.1 hypothetical protein CN398_09490 [Bacillus thuringiensis]
MTKEIVQIVKEEIKKAEGYPLLQKAIQIAFEAHEGQTDKGGNPYILHPLHVMNQLEMIDERIVGVLHDTKEDAGLTDEFFRSEGFPERIIQGIDSVTRRHDETYMEFIKRSSKDKLGRKVKKEDVLHNMDSSRIPVITEEHVSLQKRYQKGLDFLNQTEGMKLE